MGNNSLFLIIKRMRTPMFVLVITFAISILGMVLIPGVDDQGRPYHLSFFDAFYFVSYMATTIGFGESPYTFTYPQKLWVAFCIYLTVIGWFYAIGAIITLVQDKVLAAQIALAQFQRKIRKMEEPFIIFVGYNSMTRQIIDHLSKDGIRSVVIEKDEEKIKELSLENYTIEVPALAGDIRDPKIFKTAGIHKRNCRAVVSLFNDDAMNLHVALSAKLMNKHVMVVVEATQDEYGQNLKTIGADVVENPFKIVAKRVYLSLTSPSLLMIEQWLYGDPLVLRRKDRLPKEGKYIVCGYGRMGTALEVGLRRAGIDYVFIEASPEKAAKARRGEKVMVGDADDKKILLKADVQEASCIIAATKDDLLNLSIIMAAKRINPEIYTIARENHLADTVVFKAAKIDRVIMLETLMINKTYNVLARPLADRFIRLMAYRGESWGKKVVDLMKNHINNNPDTLETRIDEEHAYALVRHIEETKEEVPYSILYRRRDDWRKENPMLILYIRRGEEEHLLPDPSLPIRIGDEILFAGTKEAFEDMEYIMENIYEFYYVMQGKECELSLACKLTLDF
ncbi:potassium channel family protein [Hydrogenimonas urashimensis]|uniref:potassium channel family protein n=1 Tax=Hydrogenimonas urashimensis TaxID=2740515 RepID=UPI0019150356|nr:NAD-binding protein [Hydrogenimonas urashimensis]